MRPELILFADAIKVEKNTHKFLKFKRFKRVVVFKELTFIDYDFHKFSDHAGFGTIKPITACFIHGWKRAIILSVIIILSASGARLSQSQQFL